MTEDRSQMAEIRFQFYKLLTLTPLAQT